MIVYSRPGIGLDENLPISPMRPSTKEITPITVVIESRQAIHHPLPSKKIIQPPTIMNQTAITRFRCLNIFNFSLFVCGCRALRFFLSPHPVQAIAAHIKSAFRIQNSEFSIQNSAFSILHFAFCIERITRRLSDRLRSLLSPTHFRLLCSP